MGTTLYTSRVVLEQLGVSDYGVYSLVGGIVALFGFLNSSMSSATQRYLAYDLGKQDVKKLQKTFSATLTIHIGIAILILIASETIGLWYINFKVVLPPDRLFAANVTYQFSVLTTLIGIIQVPYDSLITAYEKMNVYAYISIIEVSLKLGLVYLLVFYGGDKLIAFAALTFIVSILIIITYQIYCRKKISASKYRFEYDKIFFRELISYSGWNLFGGLASVSRGQGINIVLNIFFGTIVNAAYGLTLQIQNAVNQFVTNFQKAVNPQIIKTFSEGNIERMHKLIIQSSKFSFLLMLLLVAPILFNTDFILSLWLKDPPKNTMVFVQLSLIGVLIDCISGPLIVAVQASGKIRNYQIIIGSLIILTLPIAALWLYMGGEPKVVFYSIILINILSFISRLFFLKILLNLEISFFLKFAVSRIVLVSIAVYLLNSILIGYSQHNSWLNLFYSIFITTLCVLSFGLSKSDYLLLKNIYKK